MSKALAVIGGGNMAKAILDGAARAGVLPPTVIVADPSAERRALFTRAVERAGEAIAQLAQAEEVPGSGQVLLAVKPQMLPEVARDVRAAIDAGVWGARRVVISILAGATASRVREAFAARAEVVRVMPNTPALVGRGMSALCLGEGAESHDADLARALFSAVGKVIDVSESQMDAFTAVGGSGPAYVFRLAEAMVAGAIEAGLDARDALLAVRETIAGAGLLLGESAESPGELRAQVTSKGGTTAAALEVFERGGFEATVVQAIVAARDRGAELSKMAGG
ncbi:MAG: pyrroline-5-carboxylate reductase [Leptolyngbya sp. PLA3]|nr:MAG: pyrroline-5-carboxylate reductase [Cyanobacteria bacterium CYA]MCE7968420.1 pyrroline-5-carboxylate reductase [Leptolyngbya sp. PL-A3]